MTCSVCKGKYDNAPGGKPNHNKRTCPAVLHVAKQKGKKVESMSDKELDDFIKVANIAHLVATTAATAGCVVQ